MYCATKYKVLLVGWEAPCPTYASPRWKSLMEVMPMVIANSQWQIDKGNALFWMDKWHEDGILFNLVEHFTYSDLGAYIGDVYHHGDLFENQIGGTENEVVSLWHQFQKLQVNSQGSDDKLIWRPVSNGVFSIKSAWSLISNRSSYDNRWRWIWSSIMPAKMSLFLWKIAWNAVSVDENIQARSVFLASKCSYCINAQTESLNHLFLHGDLASNIWSLFSRVLDMGIGGDVLDTISSWQDSGRWSSYRHTLIGILLGFICWHIWKERCKRRYSNKFRRWHLLIMDIVGECNFLLGKK